MSGDHKKITTKCGKGANKSTQPAKKKAMIAKTRPTQKELKETTAKVLKQYSVAIKNLAHR